MFRALLNSLHHTLSKSSIIVKIFLLVRNQCNSIINYYLVDSPNPDKNGENLIIDFIAKNCSTIIDVGANKGEWTNYFLKKNPEGIVFLLEPSFSAFEYLKEKFKTVTKVILINKGVSDKVGETFFFEEPDFGETSSIVPFFSNNKSIRRTITLTTIDNIGKEFNIKKIDFLKIDVEGYDFHVLKGAKEYLESKKINVIQFEYNQPWARAGSTLISAIDFLEKYEYKTYLLRKDGLYNFNYSRYGEFFRYSNFVAIPYQSGDIFKRLIKGAI